MAGFDSLGGNSLNVGGSYNPALGSVAGGQNAPSGYGIQPPRISSPYQTDYLSLPANRQSPTMQGSQVYVPGADTSAEHQANVAMARANMGQVGLEGYRGFPGEVQGTSSSSYGISPNGWQDINAFLSNPTGPWQLPIGANMGQYGNTGTDTNANRYQMMIDTIRSAMSGQWPQLPSSWPTTNPNGPYSTGQIPSWLSPGSDSYSQFFQDLPQRFGSAFGVFPPSVIQNLGVGVPSMPGIRSY